MEYLDTTEDIQSDVPEEDAAEECAVEQPDISFINLGDCEVLSNVAGRDKAAAVRRGLAKRQKPSHNFLRHSIRILPTDDHGSVSSDDSSDEDKHRSATEAVHASEEPNLKANRDTTMAHGQSVGETLVPPRVKVGLNPASVNVAAAAAAAVARSNSLRGRQPSQSPALGSDIELRGSPALNHARDTRGVDSEDEESEEMKKRAERVKDTGNVSRTPASNDARHPVGIKLPPLLPSKPAASMHWKLPAADGPPGGSSGVCSTTVEESIPEADRDRPPLPPAKPPRLKAVAADAHSLPHPRSPPPRPAKPKAVLPNPSQRQPAAAAQSSFDSTARERLPDDDRGPQRPDAAAAASAGAASPAVASAEAAGAAAASVAAARTAGLDTGTSLSKPTTADRPFSERNPFVERDVTTAVAANARPKKPERQDAQTTNDRKNLERQHEHQSWRQYDRSAHPAAVEATSISFGTTAIDRRTERSSSEEEPMRERLDSDGGDTDRLAGGTAAVVGAAAHRKRAAPVDLPTPPGGTRAASLQCFDEPATKRQQQTSETSKDLAVGGKVDSVSLGTHSLEHDEPVRATNAKRLGTVQTSDCSDSRFQSTELPLRGTDVDDRHLDATATVKGNTRLAEGGRAVFEGGVAKQHQADPAIKGSGEDSFQGTGQQQLYQHEQKQREAREFRSFSKPEVPTAPEDRASADRKSDAAAVGGSGVAAFGVALKSSSDHRGNRASPSDAHTGLPAASIREAGSVHAAREPGTTAAAAGAPQTGSSEKPVAAQQPFGKAPPPVPRPRPPQKPALLTPLQTASVGRGGMSAANQSTSAVAVATLSTTDASHPVKSSAKAIGASCTSEPPAALPSATSTAAAASAAASAASSASDSFDVAASKSASSPDDSSTLPSAGSSIGTGGGGLTGSRAAEPSAMRVHAGGDKSTRGLSGSTASALSSERAALPSVQLKHLPLKEKQEREEEEEQQQQMPSVRLRRKSPPALPAVSSAGDRPGAAALSPSTQRSSLLQRRHTHAAYDSTPPRTGGNAGLPVSTAAPVEPTWMRIAAEKAKRNSQLVDNGAREVAGSTRKDVPPTAEQDTASSRAAADADIAGGRSPSKGADSNFRPPLGGSAATQPLTSGPGGGSWRSAGEAPAVASPSTVQQGSRASGAVAAPRAGTGRVLGEAVRDAASSARVQQHRSTKEADMPSRTASLPQNDENQPPSQTVAGSPSGSTTKDTDGPLVIGRAQPLLPLTSKSSSSPDSQPLGARRHSSDSPASATNGTHTTSPRILPPDARATAVTGTLAAPVDGQADVTLRTGRPARLQPDKRVHSVIVTASGGPSSPGRLGVEETALNSPRARAGSGPKDAGDFGSQEPEFMKLFKARQSRLRASSVHTYDD